MKSFRIPQEGGLLVVLSINKNKRIAVSAALMSTGQHSHSQACQLPQVGQGIFHITSSPDKVSVSLLSNGRLPKALAPRLTRASWSALLISILSNKRQSDIWLLREL